MPFGGCEDPTDMLSHLHWGAASLCVLRKVKSGLEMITEFLVSNHFAVAFRIDLSPVPLTKFLLER